MSKWAFSFDDEYYESSTFDTREAAIEAARKAAPKMETEEAFVGRVVQPKFDYERLASSVVDEAKDQAYNNDPGEFSDDFMDDMRPEDYASLAAVIKKWFVTNNVKIPYFIIDGSEMVHL